ncbi:uncharacterized protein TNCV_1177931 [Trichonephila clavipes]|nr:uncharacterized protein TNCV_1177931 [Trichonephila clavipes]
MATFVLDAMPSEIHLAQCVIERLSGLTPKVMVWVRFRIMDDPICFFGIFQYISAVVAEWYRYRNVACFVTSSSPVPLKTRRVGQRCTLNLSRAETSSRWCGGVVRRGVPAQVSSMSLDHGSKITWSVAKSPRTDHQIGTSVPNRDIPQRSMVTCIMMGTVVPGPHGLLCF